MLAQMIVAALLGVVFGAVLGRQYGFREGYSYCYRVNGVAKREPHAGGPTFVHHDSAHGESFDYSPVNSQDAMTSIFPILDPITNTAEIPVHDFTSILTHNRKG